MSPGNLMLPWKNSGKPGPNLPFSINGGHPNHGKLILNPWTSRKEEPGYIIWRDPTEQGIIAGLIIVALYQTKYMKVWMLFAMKREISALKCQECSGR